MDLLDQFVRQLIQRAMALGSKPWHRSKVMLVGEGRVGKTALCNTMLGKPFVETESTPGLNQLTCKVRTAASATNGRWTERTKPEREFETGIAQLIRAIELHETEKTSTTECKNELLSPQDGGNNPSDSTDNSSPKSRVGSIEYSVANTNIGVSTLEQSSRNETVALEVTDGGNIEVEDSVPTFESNVPLVLEYLDEVRIRDADLILSIYDFGGQSVFNIIHHLFLTSYGVYVVVFNMLSILDENKRESSLAELSFWMKSIYMHTRSPATDGTETRKTVEENTAIATDNTVTGTTSSGTVATANSVSGNTATDNTVTGTTSTGNVATANNVSGNTVTGTTSSGNVAAANSVSGNTATDNTATGTTSTGNVATANNVSGNTATDITASGTTSTGNVATANSVSGNTATDNTATGTTSTGNVATANNVSGNTTSCNTPIDKIASGKMAPVFLVGTHKDKVNKPEKYEQISDLIKQNFGVHVGWPSVVENNDLCFFPVNNRISKPNSIFQSLVPNFGDIRKEDYASLELLTRIESVVKDADYVRETRPLTWLRALDQLIATNESFLTFKKTESIAIENGVEKAAVPIFLSFLNKMGVVLWLNEEGLRDVVILDIITFFVEPASLIICNHISKPSDSTIHHRNIQETCRKERPMEWSEMTQRGLVSQSLMKFLLSHKVEGNNIPLVVSMMLKYGLIVRVEQGQDSHHVPAQSQQDLRHLHKQPLLTYYLVPALLPATVGDPTMFQEDVWRNIKQDNTCYFIFTTAPESRLSKWYNTAKLQNEGFLPRGLMERLIGKAVKWSQLTNVKDIYNVTELYKNYAILTYGRQQFRLICIPEKNCIKLDIEGEHPLPVHNRVLEQINICIKECMGSLQVTTGLQYVSTSESKAGFILLDLEAVKEVQSKHSPFRVASFPLINAEYVVKNYGPWLINTDILPFYDVFISHRWGDDDDILCEQLYDAFLGHIVGEEKRDVQVFWDKIRIKEGQQFQTAFGTALINSTCFLPVVSSEALNKMQNHDHSKIDNVLVEWILALECMQDAVHSKMRGIFPLMFGGRKGDGCIGDLFAEGVIDGLPDTIPTASILVVKRLLTENDIILRSSLDACTVRTVVQELVNYNGMLAWKVGEKNCVCSATNKIVVSLNKINLLESSRSRLNLNSVDSPSIRSNTPFKNEDLGSISRNPGILAASASGSNKLEVSSGSSKVCTTSASTTGNKNNSVVSLIIYTSWK